jgi:FXSXX-COOH protein
VDALILTAADGPLKWAPLIDVSELPIADMLASGDSALASCVQRLVHSLDDPDGIISAFQSFAS